MSKIITTIWPPARRRFHEAEAARQQEAAEVERREALAHKKRDDVVADSLRIYEGHVKSYDLTGIGTHHGRPVALSDLSKEVERRLELSGAVERDPQIKLADNMSDKAIEDITGKLDPTALRFLLEHEDPERQRSAAKKILNARADLVVNVPHDQYATIVAEMVVRSRLKLRRHRAVLAVQVRAILLRSADPRWTEQRNGVLRPLTAAPWK